jgi:hypothetical protein
MGGRLTDGLGDPNLRPPNRKCSVHRTSITEVDLLKRFLPLIAIVALLGAACGSGGGTTTTTSQGEETSEEAGTPAEAISFGEALAQIRGHHRIALELYSAGDQAGALTHAGHPIDEIIASVRSELDEHGGPAQELADSLIAVRTAVQAEADGSEIESLIGETATLTADAESALAGDDAETSAYTGSVIAALLGTSAHEYEEAVAGGNGEVKLEAEYQDGYAFMLEARAMYDEIAGEVESAAIEEAEEIEEAFEKLATAFPGPTPPQQLADSLDVESAAELIGHELEETVGATLLETSDPAEIAEKIEHLLDEIVETYEAGDAEAAAELSAEAYLENYEVIEAEVIENAPEINEELEPLLGADLRRQLQEGASVEDIQAMVDRAKELLADALEALEH